MKIVHIHAVYKSWPMWIVVETDTEEVFELSLTELRQAQAAFTEPAWKRLVDVYKVFYYSPHSQPR